MIFPHLIIFYNMFLRFLQPINSSVPGAFMSCPKKLLGLRAVLCLGTHWLNKRTLWLGCSWDLGSRIGWHSGVVLVKHFLSTIPVDDPGKTQARIISRLQHYYQWQMVCKKVDTVQLHWYSTAMGYQQWLVGHTINFIGNIYYSDTHRTMTCISW